MEFAHIQDNMGFPQPKMFGNHRLQEKYSGAEIVSSTIDDFARIVAASKEQLPIVPEELGDTWIYGAGTDPYKLGSYKELLHSREQWGASQPSAPGTPQWQELCRNLMLICEHTWGKDSKRWFSDYRNWENKRFKKPETATES